MNLPEVEKKWQKKWAETNLYKFDKHSDKPKKYVLEMFSYPSGAKLHAGHWYNYSLADTYARYLRMKGFNVFHPMGFDAFGLPAENYAIKTGIHPEDSTLANIATMEGQLKAMGASFDWDYEIKTCPITTNGRSGAFCSCIKRAWPTARLRRSTGAPIARQFWQTNRW